MWKPGQLVTIHGEVYRIKRNDVSFVCRLCSFRPNWTCDLHKCEPKSKRCFELIPSNCYFEKLKPKRL